MVKTANVIERTAVTPASRDLHRWYINYRIGNCGLLSLCAGDRTVCCSVKISLFFDAVVSAVFDGESRMMTEQTALTTAS